MGLRDRLRRLRRSTQEKPSEHRWLLDLTAHRDGQIYQPAFGRPWRMSIEPAPLSRLHAVVPRVDPRWAHIGVYAYPPHLDRKAWLHLTTGLSNPWHDALPPPRPADPDAVDSGAGLELCMLLPERTPWAMDALNAVMAHQQCIASGVLEGQALAIGDVITPPMFTLPRGPALPDGLTGLRVVSPAVLQEGFQLPYGRVRLLQLMPISASRPGS